MIVTVKTICAHTEFECDCDCGCFGYGGDPNHECDWPDCGCDCKPECKGCALVREAGNGHEETSA